jgi:hypothetical protein
MLRLRTSVRGAARWKQRQNLRHNEMLTKAVLVTVASGLLGFGAATLNAAPLASPAAQTAGTQASMVRAVGTVKTITGNKLVLASDSGAETAVVVEDSARVVRIEPGQKDLKSAEPVQLQDIQPGDRVLVRGGVDASKTLSANLVVLMKGADIAQKQARERQDWDKRGVGGLVKSVDTATGEITVSAGTPPKMVKVETSKSTIIRRYAPGSVKFDDAVIATLDQIKPGDQLRARGNRSADGTTLTAEEIVAGSFRNVAGTINSVDAAAKTITVTDLLTKKPLVVKFTADSQMHQLPLPVAQRIAMRLKFAAARANAPSGAPAPHPQEPMQAGGSRGQRPGGAADVQQLLNQMPVVTLADLKKGDAVMIVTTQEQAANEAAAITLLSGVEPILAASPNDNRAAMLLSPWNLDSGGGSESEQQ